MCDISLSHVTGRIIIIKLLINITLISFSNLSAIIKGMEIVD